MTINAFKSQNIVFGFFFNKATNVFIINANVVQYVDKCVKKTKPPNSNNRR